jgi:hypothetical protein
MVAGLCFDRTFEIEGLLFVGFIVVITYAKNLYILYNVPLILLG